MPFEFVPGRGTHLPIRAAGTIGVFDGVHRGHAELFARVRESSRASGVAALVLTFDPYPVQVFAPSATRYRIACRSVTTRLVRAAGMDHVGYLPFSREMAAWEPDRFLDHLLDFVDLTCLWVGPDFRFGKDRAGDHRFLVEAGVRRGFDVQRLEPILEDGRPISSTWVRELLRAGDVTRAAELLGHPFELEGRVVPGDGIGSRELVATANLAVGPEQLLPRWGIYAGWAFDPEGRWSGEPRPAVASVGVRPTITVSGEDRVEIHLLDWQGDLYGERLAFRFVDWIRPEVHFPDLATLRQAIEQDLREVRARLSGRPTTSSLRDGH